jgi:hypothetical protein
MFCIHFVDDEPVLKTLIKMDLKFVRKKIELTRLNSVRDKYDIYDFSVTRLLHELCAKDVQE